MNKIYPYVTLLLFVLAACSKPENQRTVDNPPNPADTIVKGSLFLNINSRASSINTENGSMTWQNPNFCEAVALSYDSGYLYAGSYRNVSCFNAATGQRLWVYSWLIFSDVKGFTRYAFTDSLMFITSASSAWDVAHLYCINKRTGALRWSNELDSIGWPNGREYFSLPVLSNGKVITVARDNNNHRRLVAYNLLTGKKIWGTGINDELRFNIKVDNDKIYSTGKNTFCYDANTGVLVWQNNINIINASGSIENGYLMNNTQAYIGPLAYFDQNKIIIAGKDSANAVVTSVKVLDKNTGAILSSKVYNIDFKYYMYSNNTLYISTYVSNTTFLHAFDINTSAFKWKYETNATYPPILTDKNIIYSRWDGTYFLSLDGKLMRFLPHTVPSGNTVYTYLYKDLSNNIFTQRIN